MAVWPQISIGSGRARKGSICPDIGWARAARPGTLPASAAMKEHAMANAYYSTVFEQRACDVWNEIRDFNNYSIWVRGEGFSEIEDGKSGDTIGAIRSVQFRDLHIRQRLLAQSD